jgi:hypothetical protein
MRAGGRFSLGFLLAPLALLYGRTLSRSIVPGDSAELVTGAVTLGVCHPTGYPLYVLLGKLATLVVFFASPVIVVNALSAACLLAALTVLYRALSRLGHSRISTVGALLLLGTAPPLWRYATAAEVYTLHALLFAGIVSCLVDAEREGRERPLVAAFFLAGLALGNHMTSLLFLPGLALFALRRSRARSATEPPLRWWRLVAAFGAGASVLFLLFAFDRESALNYISQYAREFPEVATKSRVGRIAWLVSGEQFGAVGSLRAFLGPEFGARFGP